MKQVDDVVPGFCLCCECKLRPQDPKEQFGKHTLVVASRQNSTILEHTLAQAATHQGF
jgi:hypothetical protein